MDAPSEPSPAGNCRGGGCFNFFRRAFSTDQSSIPSVKSVINVTDDYVIMKQQLITKPLLRAELTEPHHHFTERDVRADFASDSPGNMEKTKQTARRIRSDYVTNKSWWGQLFKRCLPIIDTLRHYKREYILEDVAAGISAGIAAIPMGMSYALLAGLPPAHGLYNNLLYPFIYMFFGSARQVCVGTSAIEALMSSQAVANVVGYDAPPHVWLNATIGLSFWTGIILITFRILGLGVIASFLADPVLSGFSTGSALVIATSQLKNVFGMTIPRLSTFSTWIFVIKHLGEAHWGCFIITFLGVFLLWITKYANSRWFKKFQIPGSLFAIAIFVLIGFLMKIDKPPFSVKVLGDIPRGLPTPMVFDFHESIAFPLFKQALWFSVLYFVIHISIAKTIAQQKDYLLDANQEVLSLGICGLFGSFFQCFPIGSSLTRSSIASVVGAHTTLWNITNCAVVLLTVTVLTPLFYYLPLATLSSVILFGVFFMTYFGEAWRLLKLLSLDFVLWAASCIVTVFWGAMEGIICSVALSLLWLLKKDAFPSTAVLGRLPGTMVYRNVKRFPMAQEISGMKIVRFDASLNFSNAEQFERFIVKTSRLDSDEKSGSNAFDEVIVKVLVVDASSINDADVTSIRMLQRLAKRMQSSGRILLFANWKGSMRDFLDRANFYDVVRPEHCFLSLVDAVQWAQEFYLEDRRLAEVQKERQ